MIDTASHDVYGTKDTVTDTKSETDFNPGIIIRDYIFLKKTFHVVRDDELEAGTKQRALISWLKDMEGSEFVYAGPVFGYAQIALALAAKINGKKATLFLEKRSPRHPLTQKAGSLGADIIEIRRGAHLKEVQQAAEEYTTERKDEGTVLLPLGLHTPQFIDILTRQVHEAITKTHPHLMQHPPKRMWLVVGSATILAALHKIWPQTHFLCVQVEGMNHTIYIAPERFDQISRRLPPYPSVCTYDAKLWQFVEDHGEDGDYIWNVGRDVSPGYDESDQVRVNDDAEDHGSDKDRIKNRQQVSDSFVTIRASGSQNILSGGADIPITL
ncbi:hypothetical protein PROFUN_10931 [Planoprotostelium fungivorum]|uniref:Uncharacterized protein n=1 Tax=Planoprotostelium fungivorum TaxID=1890364 RepID=A0A2P6NC12_9EUKA|nr:hypothetical protein PROFUN_10931 [Planoprotostelium fungivorum]